MVRRLIAAGMLASVAMFGVGCDPEPNTPGEAIEEAGNEIGNAVDDAANEVEDAVNE